METSRNKKPENKMSKKEIIVLIISAVAAVGAIAVLIINLLGGRITFDSPSDTSGNTSSENQTTEDEINDLISAVKDLPDQAAQDFIFSELDGYWTSGNLFVAFTTKDGKHTIKYGLYGASYGETGDVQEAEVEGTNTFCLTVLIAATPANEMDGARPERTETTCVDVSNFKDENRLNIKIDNNSIGGRQWHTYEFGGSSLEEAFKDGMVEEF